MAQRLVARRFLEKAVEHRLSGLPLETLWDEFTRFEAAGQLVSVSSREAINRCYQLSLGAQRVAETIGSLHRVFRDVQASEQAAQQGRMLQAQVRMTQEQVRMTEEQGHLIEEQKRTEARLRLIEIFIVTVYSAELVHILGQTGRFPESYTFWGVVVLGLLALFTVLGHHKRAVKAGESLKTMPLLWISIAALAVWVVGGMVVEHYHLFEPIDPPTVPPHVKMIKAPLP